VHALRHSLIVVLAALGLCALSGAAVAQQYADDPAADQQAAAELDPPTHAARLSYVEGAVSVQPAGVDEWTAAAINRPLTSGDRLWSDRGSRAEIELGSAIVRLADSSSVSLLNLGDEAVQLQLSAGTAAIVLRNLDPTASFEIDAPNATVSLVQPGSYRIGVDGAGNTTVALRDGQVQVITGAGQSIILRGGQGAQFGADGGVDVAALAPPDDFERWCAQRDQRWARNRNAAQYVSGDVVGAQDLDDYGQWREEPQYGYVWYPTQIAADWVPYRYGRWLWITPWGWTWVDSAPWGYAPFHYGRWAYLRQRWAWVPAPPHTRAVYAPALVAWIGAPAVGVGWLPLAPGEVYLPGYRVSPRYLQNVNATNTSIVNNTYITNVYRNPGLQSRYANRDAPRAVTVVSPSNFASGQSIAGRSMALPPEWHGAAATPQPPAILPARQSVLGPSAQAPVKRPPIAIMNRPVVARHEPPPAPAPFERQMDAIRANGGRALPPAQLQQLRGPENPRPNVVLAPPTPRSEPTAPASPATGVTPLTPANPATRTTPVSPVASAIRVTPVAAVTPVSPTPSRSTPIDRRVIPERSPQYQPPMQSSAPAQSQSLAQSRGQGADLGAPPHRQAVEPGDWRRPPPPAAPPPPPPPPPREFAQPAAAPPPPPPPPPPAQSLNKTKPTPQVERSTDRKLEPR
jgi:hypothetical protein